MLEQFERNEDQQKFLLTIFEKLDEQGDDRLNLAEVRGGLFELAVDDNAKHTNDNTVCNCREHRQVVPTNDSHIV